MKTGQVAHPYKSDALAFANAFLWASYKNFREFSLTNGHFIPFLV